MPLFDTLRKLTTARGRACLILQHAKRFAIGPIGPMPGISLAQRALELLIRQHAIGVLGDLQKQASLTGQMYALLGLKASGDPSFSRRMTDYRERKDPVTTQLACFVVSRPVHEIAADIAGGKYSELLDVPKSAT